MIAVACSSVNAATRVLTNMSFCIFCMSSAHLVMRSGFCTTRVKVF